MREITLEERIKAELASYNGLMGVYVNDFKGNKVEINTEEKFETASCIKTFILGTLFDEVEKGNKSLTDILTYTKENEIDGSGVLRSLDFGVQLTAKNMATLMIIVSDNAATNIMIDYLGLETINNFIKSHGFMDTVLHNKINFVMYDQLGTTTPKDYGRIFELICKEELISTNASRQMLEIFKKQHYNSTLTKSFPQYFLDSEDTGEEELIYVASKSGSMNACRNDGGIISTPYDKYVIVLFNKNFTDPIYYPDHPATVFSSKVSRLIFDQYLTLQGKLK
ncbi:serine hydrolase [Anaerocolumna sedimenticola]|uniref:Serine hydrolase n=1 Tax=Anaerocolumna sedimenticola TaxID=2696063 RepID=A0A6P1TM26_9FIRM|nr:serine hydrolase [Anaerocolumna sedimenticola]QHQ61347.1 serine hydrolase [Anaerocolumna sedimenticola]